MLSLPFFFYAAATALGPQDVLKTETDARLTHGDTWSFKANLSDSDNQAKRKSVLIETKVTGIRIIDPAQSDRTSGRQEGHFHYRLDDGAVLETIQDKMSFHNLSRGTHKIEVSLAGNDHSPLGPEETFFVKIP